MAVKFQTYARDVKLQPGQALHFQKGRGYFAAAAPAAAVPPGYMYSGSPESMAARAPGFVPTRVVRPVRPIVTPGKQPPVDPYAALDPSKIDQRATDLANAGLTPQQEEVRRQQALAAAQAKADEGAITGFQTAAGELMKGIPGEISGAYDAAGRGIGAIGAGVGGQIGSDLAQEQAANDAFAASQGQSGGTSSNGQTGNVVGMLGGVIPGTSFEEEGAARAAAAADAIRIPLNAGREELASRMAQARQTNDQYAQQLLSLAAQFPGLKAQALQQLNQYEIDKANYRESRRVNTANIAAQRADTKRQDRAERANEIIAGARADTAASTLKYKWASLNFQTQKELDRAKAAAAKGKRIDVQASKLLGHIVYQDGTEDTSIHVKQTTGTDPRTKALKNRAAAVQTARQGAFTSAKSTLGKPTAVPAKVATAARASGAKVGQYIADPSQKYGVPGGVFPPAYPGAPATTNDPTRAQRTGGAANYAAAQQQVWAAIAGDSLMSRYGLSREQVMGYVNAALKAAGWKR